jgi:hypothetical protein
MWEPVDAVNKTDGLMAVLSCQIRAGAGKLSARPFLNAKWSLKSAGIVTATIIFDTVPDFK